MGAAATDAHWAVDLGVALFATFVGVLAALLLEAWVRRRADRRAFRSIIQSVAHEAWSNEAAARNIRDAARPGNVIINPIVTSTLEAALGTSLFYAFAPSTLILAMRTVAVDLHFLRARMDLQLSANAGGRSSTRGEADDIAVRAENCFQIIEEVLTPELKAVLGKLFHQAVSHPGTQALFDRVDRIHKHQHAQLERIRQPAAAAPERPSTERDG